MDTDTLLTTIHSLLKEEEKSEKQGQWADAMAFYQIHNACQASEMFQQSAMDTMEPKTMEVVRCLMRAAHQLTGLFRFDLACQCYRLALTTVAKAMRTTETPENMDLLCDCFQGYFETLMYTREAEAATGLVNQYQPFLSDSSSDNHRGLLILVQAYYDLGLTHINKSLLTSGLEMLVKAIDTFKKLPPSYSGSALEARLLTRLGQCKMGTGDLECLEVLQRARQLWQQLSWPLDHMDLILIALKHHFEILLVKKCIGDDTAYCSELLKLHDVFYHCNKSMQVAEMFAYLGVKAFTNENERKAVTYFQQSLDLNKQVPDKTEYHWDEIIRLLRFIGVACYNCRDFPKAASAYHECLGILEQRYPLLRLDQVAECCASLGFTYSRLRNFDNMLCFYKRALDLKHRLAQEDLQLIETNIGSLYHVKAVQMDQAKKPQDAKYYYDLADEAFSKALRYSWKSFPFINFGYYLYCQGHHRQAADILQQGYLNSVIDKDTVEFDHTEDPILIKDLRFELEGREDIRMPAVVISLYLRVLAQVESEQIAEARSTAAQLQLETNSCKFEVYYHDGFGLPQMKALSYSLLGYAFRHLDCHAQASQAFHMAVDILPDYKAAKVNLQKCQKALKHH